MKISVVGAGYVGLVGAACFADTGNEVVCVDKDVGKIEKLMGGEVPIYEPGLTDIISKNIKENRLVFTTDMAKGISDSRVCFITVDTPCDINGLADITNVIEVAESIGEVVANELVIVTKSTVPVGTTIRIKEIVLDKLRKRNRNQTLIKVASNPEFLKEGDAISDFKKPYRVIVGVECGNDGVADLLHELYLPFMRKSDRYNLMDIASAELTKYASNAMLATRVSFMNSLARLCEKVGANIESVRRGMGDDPRIGMDFLFAGIGYGGSCFPKDVNALISLGREYGEQLPVIEGVRTVNDTQVDWFFKKIEKYFLDKGGLKEKTAAVWGMAFKANTDDIRESNATRLVNLLLDANVRVRVYDPVALDNARKLFCDKLSYSDNMYQCVDNADFLVVCTDWSEFRVPNWNKLRCKMKKSVIFDGRNLYSTNHSVDDYFGIGVVHSGV